MVRANKQRPEKLPAAAEPPGTGEMEKTAAMEKTERPLRPSQCRRHLRKTVAAAYRDIVAGFVEQAKSGSCQHLKMATEMVEPAKRAKAEPREKGPAALLMEKLERECG